LAERFRSSHPDLADKRLLIFLGRLHPKKRPDAVIRAMTSIATSVPDAVLLVVGSGEPGYVDKLRSLAGGLGLSQRVRFLGLLTGDAKWGALAASKLFVLPSLQENFAIAMAEALHLGMPVLITKNINTWREIVGAGAGIVLREEALEDDIARHAADLLRHPDTCLAMGNNARALAQRAYTWPASAQKVCAVYDRVIAEHSVASG
jgi:glycosyltransferase involved in cell wall biosynthesis